MEEMEQKTQWLNDVFSWLMTKEKTHADHL